MKSSGFILPTPSSRESKKIPVQVPFIDLGPQYKPLAGELKRVIGRVLDSRRFVLAENVRALETEIAGYLGVKHAVGVASGSDALFLSFLALGIGPGDEVITTPFTFFATAGAVSRAGARPVFVDIDPATFNLNPNQIKSKITKRTKAVVPVHLFGLSCDMKAIRQIAAERSLPIVEDAAQAFGADYFGKKSGTLGNLGCFSFYPTKNFSAAGDAGMVTTSSDALAEKLRILRDHGSKKKYYHEMIGINSRLDEIQAAVLRVKLKRIDRWNAARERHAADYSAAFKNLPLRLPAVPKGLSHVFHLYSVVADRRDELADFLSKRGVGHGVYYPLPLHLQRCYADLGYREGDFPVSERTAQSILSLPMYPELSAAQKKYVIRTVKSFFEERR